jgi:hypothetical protein
VGGHKHSAATMEAAERPNGAAARARVGAGNSSSAKRLAISELCAKAEADTISARPYIAGMSSSPTPPPVFALHCEEGRWVLVAPCPYLGAGPFERRALRAADVEALELRAEPLGSRIPRRAGEASGRPISDLI